MSSRGIWISQICYYIAGASQMFSNMSSWYSQKKKELTVMMVIHFQFSKRLASLTLIFIHNMIVHTTYNIDFVDSLS